MRLLKTIVAGTAAGGVATGAMSAFMFAVWRPHSMGQKPPERITEGILNRLGISRDEATQDALAAALHLGFGMATGSLFALVREYVPVPVPGVLQGVVYGTGVWAASYKGWVPEMGFLPPPEEDRPGRQEAMVAAHLVYGGVLGLLLRPDRAG